MTHGSIIVIGPDGRSIFLHTYHTGMNIPKVVNGAPAFMAIKRYSFLRERDFRKKIKSKRRLVEHLAMLNAGNGLDYPPIVAAMLIATEPNLLEIYPENYLPDLTCGCEHRDSRDKLELISETQWNYETSWTEDGLRQKIKINPFVCMVNALFEK